MRLFKNLNVRILKSIITWSAMGKQTAQAEEVYTVKGTPKEPAVDLLRLNAPTVTKSTF